MLPSSSSASTEIVTVLPCVISSPSVGDTIVHVGASLSFDFSSSSLSSSLLQAAKPKAMILAIRIAKNLFVCFIMFFFMLIIVKVVSLPCLPTVAIWPVALCGRHPCQPLQNFARYRGFQATTAPAIGYIACWRFVGFYFTVFINFISSNSRLPYTYYP